MTGMWPHRKKQSIQSEQTSRGFVQKPEQRPSAQPRYDKFVTSVCSQGHRRIAFSFRSYDNDNNNNYDDSNNNNSNNNNKTDKSIVVSFFLIQIQK